MATCPYLHDVLAVGENQELTDLWGLALIHLNIDTSLHLYVGASLHLYIHTSLHLCVYTHTHTRVF